MCASSPTHSYWVILFLLAIATIGCSRLKYRLQADHDAYHVIAERNCDPRWQAADVSIDMDPRSRYFDAYDPDHSPMPLDDPSSHQYMQIVDGKKGWKHWHDNGDRVELENPAWREALAEYVETGADGSVKLDVDTALRLAYVHSPSHQQQLETLYLSALDVSAERFRLDTQFFGGYDARYAHNGSLIAPGLTYRRFIITPAIDADGADVNRLTVGRPFGADPAASAKRQLATAGELLVGFANSFVFEFTSGDANLATSLANFSFIQPLLRGAGKDVALEDLTFNERKLLANLRAYGQFLQGFYTQVAIGELGVTGPQRFGHSTNLQSFSGSGGVGGYLDLLQQRQRIRNSEDNLSLQLRTLTRLEALYDNDLTTLVQVDQFRQSVQTQRAALLLSRNSFELALDRYKTNTLGLPPDLSIELDESLIQQFQLVPREATTIQDSLRELQTRVGEVADLLEAPDKVAELQTMLGGLADDAGIELVRELLTETRKVAEVIQTRLEDLPQDLARVDEQALSDVETELVQFVRARIAEGSNDFEAEFEAATDKLKKLIAGLAEENTAATLSENGAWLREFLHLSEAYLVVQARARRVEGEPDRVLNELLDLIDPVRRLFDGAQQDLAHMDAVWPDRQPTMTEEDKELFYRERERLGKLFADLKGGQRGFDVAAAGLQALRVGLSAETRSETTRALISWVQEFLQVVERLVLVPAQARLEMIMVKSIDLGAEDAFQVALANRLDFMNGRASLVDQWRLIQINADALQSVLNITASGELRTARNNPVSFRAPTGSARLGLEFDAPFTRLLERNAYRESLIDYQQSRRSLIQSHDSLHLGVRALIRNLEQLRQNLEIQRRAVTIALRRVDQTQLDLNPPRQPVQPGFRPPINQTLSIQLLGAQTALRDSQNAFLAAWLNYYAMKIRLYRELGIMVLDPEGRWIEYAIGESSEEVPTNEGEEAPLPLPPMVPATWMEVVNSPTDPSETRASVVERASYSVIVPPSYRLRRLPPTERVPRTN